MRDARRSTGRAEVDASNGSEGASTISVTISAFATAQLKEEAARQKVSVGDLAAHAIVYYLADADAGRVSWPVPHLEPRRRDGQRREA